MNSSSPSTSPSSSSFSLFRYTVVSGIVHHAVLYAACGQSRASSFIFHRDFDAKFLSRKKKNSMCNIGATLSPFIYFTISINRSSDLNLNTKEIYIRVVCNVIV